MRAGVEKGLHACFIHPGYVLGPYEMSNFSEMFRLLKEGGMPGTFSGSGPWCHVEKVVEAMIRGAEVARPGDRYLIGAAHASLAEVAAKIALRVGVDPPRTLPSWLYRSIAQLMEWGSFVTGKEPDLTPEVVHMFSMDVSFDCSKAERELGYREASLDRMIDDTYTWLQEEGRI